MALQILQWNACSLTSRRHELQQLLSTKQYDIVCVQETFLKPGKKCCLAGYDCIRQDRTDSQRGGIAILIKNGINFTELRKPADDMECQAVSIKTSAGSITVINVYIPREMISAVRLWTTCSCTEGMSLSSETWMQRVRSGVATHTTPEVVI